MHLIIHRLYSTEALLATPSPVDQLSSIVVECLPWDWEVVGSNRDIPKTLKMVPIASLRVFGHGLGGLIKPFYCILKRPLWLPPNLAPKVHTKKGFHQTTEFCFTWWNFFHSQMMQATVLTGTWMPQNFFSTLLCLETILHWRSVWLHAWFVFSHALSTVRPTTDKKKCCPLVCLHPWGTLGKWLCM